MAPSNTASKNKNFHMWGLILSLFTYDPHDMVWFCSAWRTYSIHFSIWSAWFCMVLQCLEKQILCIFTYDPQGSAWFCKAWKSSFYDFYAWSAWFVSESVVKMYGNAGKWMLGAASRCSGLLWLVLGCSELLWGALCCSGLFAFEQLIGFVSMCL